MAHTSRTESLKPPLRPIVVLCPPIDGSIGRGFRRHLTQPQHRSPLLHLLPKVDIIHRLVYRPIERLELGPPPVVTRIRRLDNGLLLSARMDNPSLSTIMTPPTIHPRVIPRISIALKRHTSKGASSSKHIRIRPHQQIRHHPAARHARDKNPGRISVILLDSPADHANDTQGITAPIVRQAFLGRQVPALIGRVGRVRVDDDVPMRVCWPRWRRTESPRRRLARCHGTSAG